MKRVSALSLAALALVLSVCGAARTQSGVKPPDSGPSSDRAGADKAPAGVEKADEARALYEEAAVYVERKFEEFRRQQLPYDRTLEEKTYREQKELALQNALKIAGRESLRGTDFYYAGLLYALADKGERSLGALRRFLEDRDASPAELRQRARSVAAQQAAQLGLTDEAERSLAEYARGEPRDAAELYRANVSVAGAYVKKKDYARAAPRAADAYAAALEYARAADPSKRDALIYGAGAFYANVLVKAGRQADAVRVADEMRARAVALPSAGLYRQATELFLTQGGEFGAPPAVPGVEPAVSPEIKVAELIGRGPARLSELRGKVVFLDFWATWCTYCVQTMPRLNALQQKYADRGLVVLGINEFEGEVDGRAATRAEELEHFRRFKQKMKVTYDFGVAADAGNSRLYGIASLPTGVLIDRRGRVRFITIGASEEEAELLKKMVVRLLDEQP